MTTTARPPVSALLPRTIDGYDLDAETARAAAGMPDVAVAGRRLHRATARVEVAPEPASWETTRKVHRERVFSSTLDPDSPVVELGWPTSGHYVMDSRGVHFDLYLGVAQKLVDERHPRLVAAVDRLRDLGLLLRREIATDDYLRAAPHAEGVWTPADVSGLLGEAARAAWPEGGAWRTFFTNSGTESIEACLKLAYEVRYKRFLATHGASVLAQVMAELGIREFTPLAVDTSKPEPVYEDYPFFVVGCRDAFHGRTLGSLSVTASKKAQKLGFPRLRWVRHVAANEVGALAAVVDPTPLRTLLATPGALRRVVESGKVPAELWAGFVVEAIQGEGGYVPLTPEFAKDCERTCRAHGALFLLDEVQTFGRTGTVFYGEQLGVVPDAVALAKGLLTAAMIARAEYEEYLHVGWHSNTWGGGKVFDNQVAYTVLDVLLHERSEVFDGRTLPENLRVKGKLVEAGLAALQERHPGIVRGTMVRGGLARLSVTRRADVLRAGLGRGIKLLPCGRAGDVSAIRLVFLADVLAKEVRDAMDLLDASLADVA
jgi:4-aminobutyrate aminotransferase-like enzyme